MTDAPPTAPAPTSAGERPGSPPGWLRWTTVAPVLALVVLALAWGRTPAVPVQVVVALLLGLSVLAAGARRPPRGGRASA